MVSVQRGAGNALQYSKDANDRVPAAAEQRTFATRSQVVGFAVSAGCAFCSAVAAEPIDQHP
jgi:hypothetical protein